CWHQILSSCKNTLFCLNTKKNSRYFLEIPTILLFFVCFLSFLAVKMPFHYSIMRRFSSNAYP
ncbi:MAG TPA: hypothetical protein PLL13_14465, partial [Prevotella sp.]|nr:hypothetical protein [Prevotella sp.]